MVRGRVTRNGGEHRFCYMKVYALKKNHTNGSGRSQTEPVLLDFAHLIPWVVCQPLNDSKKVLVFQSTKLFLRMLGHRPLNSLS